MRPKSDLNQLMYADCRLCSDIDKNNAVLCNSIFQQYFSQIHAQKGHVLHVFAMHFWYGMTVYMYTSIQMHNLLWFSASVHYQLYIGKENRLYMHVLKSYAHIGSVLSSF